MHKNDLCKAVWERERERDKQRIEIDKQTEERELQTDFSFEKKNPKIIHFPIVKANDFFLSKYMICV